MDGLILPIRPQKDPVSHFKGTTDVLNGICQKSAVDNFNVFTANLKVRKALEPQVKDIPVLAKESK